MLKQVKIDKNVQWKTPSRFMLQKHKIRAGLLGHLTRMQVLPSHCTKDSVSYFIRNTPR